jgi:UDP-GlcNAc:undecaprenyl-phosphate GlcNAc-1-phosphate transferase
VLYSYLACFLLSVFLSFVLTKSIRNFAIARGWVAPPQFSRHLHSKPVPRLGGVAIFLTVMSVLGASFLASKWLAFTSRFPIGTALYILGPAALVFLLGLYDDIWSVGPYAKFGIQGLAALWLYAQGLGIHQFDLLLRGHVLGGFLGLPLTILWVLLITNAFNLIDGLDGLAAGSALFSTFVVLVLSLLAQNHLAAFLCVLLAGTIVGFLRFNFNPATIFLGDSGSLFVGFMLSALALAGSQKAPTMVAVAIPIVSFGLPILDVAIAVVRRFLSGKPLFGADSEHIHHKLLKRGLSQREAVLILYGVSAGFALLSLGLLHGGGTIAIVLLVLGAGMCLGIQQLRYPEFVELRRVFQRTISQKQIIKNDLNIRRATELLTSCADVHELYRILIDTLQPLEFDGFTLRLSPDVCLADSFLVPLSRAPDGGFYLCWASTEHLGPGWELKLELITRSGNRCGFLSVYKRFANKPLLMDMSLLTDGFHAALADAVRRTIPQTQPASRDHDEVETYSHAQAASAVSGK